MQSLIFWISRPCTLSYFWIVHEENWFCGTCPFGSGTRMMIHNTYPNLDLRHRPHRFWVRSSYLHSRCSRSWNHCCLQACSFKKHSLSLIYIEIHVCPLTNHLRRSARQVWSVAARLLMATLCTHVWIETAIYIVRDSQPVSGRSWRPNSTTCTCSLSSRNCWHWSDVVRSVALGFLSLEISLKRVRTSPLSNWLLLVDTT